MAGDRAIEAVGEAVQQDERQRCRVALQRQQRPGAATDDEAAPGDTVGGDATARAALPESLERRVDDLLQAGVAHGRPRQRTEAQRPSRTRGWPGVRRREGMMGTQWAYGLVTGDAHSSAQPQTALARQGVVKGKRG